MKFTIALLAMVKAPRRVFGSSPKIRRLADLKLNELKAALSEVCARRELLCELQFIHSFIHSFIYLLRITSTNKLVRLIADTVCGAANVNKIKDTTHPQG